MVASKFVYVREEVVLVVEEEVGIMVAVAVIELGAEVSGREKEEVVSQMRMVKEPRTVSMNEIDVVS